MSVNHDVKLSSIQWRTSNHQDRAGTQAGKRRYSSRYCS